VSQRSVDTPRRERGGAEPEEKQQEAEWDRTQGKWGGTGEEGASRERRNEREQAGNQGGSEGQERDIGIGRIRQGGISCIIFVNRYFSSVIFLLRVQMCVKMLRE
jgi:hypothetical protein